MKYRIRYSIKRGHKYYAMHNRRIDHAMDVFVGTESELEFYIEKLKSEGGFDFAIESDAK